VQPTDQPPELTDRLRAISPEVLGRIGRQRTALIRAVDGLREASRRTPEIATDVEQLRAALLGHIALVDAVFDAIRDDEAQSDPSEQRDSGARHAR
jgi:MoxR-like ATPase